MNEKNTVPAAAPTPAVPSGAKSAKLSTWNAVNASTTNITSTASLITTITALAAADSLTPRTSSSAHSATSTIAGRLITPPAPGAAESAAGMPTPTVASSNALRYSDQPTATAAEDTEYSSSRHAATAMATDSPRVA